MLVDTIMYIYTTHIYIHCIYFHLHILIVSRYIFIYIYIYMAPAKSTIQYYGYKLYMTQVLRLLLAALTGSEGQTIAVCLKDFRSSKVVGSLPQL